MGFLIKVDGIVQGVGFRPFVYNLATSLNLNGYVKNSSQGVIIYIECSRSEKDLFIKLLKDNAPRSSSILSLDCEERYIDIRHNGFVIFDSEKNSGVTLIPADMAICNDCERELFEKNNRRYLYPFINCTNCGPRYSIIKTIPYDRPNTTMDIFKICDECLKEYQDLSDRRFHAQPNCCRDCGPDVYFDNYRGVDAIKKIAELIDYDEIVAFKGLGGYHIICDATNDNTINRLRKLKKRLSKPLAVMVKNPDILNKYSIRDIDIIKNMLLSPQSPIVIFEWNNHPLSKYINPLSEKIGLMAAYTPMHKILFHFLKTEFIVATSGNLKDEPITISEKDAEEKLKIFTNYFLHHNRPIHNRVDDSVVTIVDGNIYPIRRSRGYSPNPVILKKSSDISVFGAGAQLKNHLSMTKGRYAFISQFIGDLDNMETEIFYEETFNKLRDLFDIKISHVVHDIHPDYRSTIFAKKFAQENDIKVSSIQHHKAHMYACMAEHGLSDNLIGVIFDGTGLGEDGNIWGGEFFCKKGVIKRIYHLEYYVQPGGDASAKNPYRMLLGYLIQNGVEDNIIRMIADRFDANEEVDILKKVIDNKINSFLTSSMGRLFEAVGSLITGIKTNEFEAHSAIALESLGKMSSEHSYPFKIKDHKIEISEMLTEIIHDLMSSLSIQEISYRFHNTVAEIILECCKRISETEGVKDVVLSGGVFQNTMLLSLTLEKIRKAGLSPYIHREVPANDASISLGQVYSVILDNQVF
ncbi:MAG: carbamoyltransferase HypF [Calditerrivibrio sp.]|nr:carbamoyltransferase HypF [Calditerrivibrio sp.]